ncbi:hypothetical protein PQO03_10375 [Lentisphaera profundi]|uniref:Uncharacterized protein n=1 Tax=Lentisphaera profundi TaxID=1658616 RepID=A0ABY7VVM7_9BACT|nr:hypothetical protein [Lentisphaera profundi]WDE96118.1 hypothetical protein PQO03_10375 [Lentisphaera profundi]
MSECIYLQKMNGIYFIPLFAVIVVGMLSKKVPSIAAKVGLAIGFTIIPIGYFVPMGSKLNDAGEKISIYLSGDIINGFHFLGISFAIIIVAMLIIGAIAPRKTAFIQEDVKAVDMTEWKHAKLTGGILVVLVAIIYGIFADFSALSKDHNNPEGRAKYEAAQEAAKIRKKAAEGKSSTIESTTEQSMDITVPKDTDAPSTPTVEAPTK